MGLKIGGYLFSGPFDIEKAEIRKHQKPVVFAIICREGQPWTIPFDRPSQDFDRLSRL